MHVTWILLSAKQKTKIHFNMLYVPSRSTLDTRHSYSLNDETIPAFCMRTQPVWAILNEHWALNTEPINWGYAIDFSKNCCSQKFNIFTNACGGIFYILYAIAPEAFCILTCTMCSVIYLCKRKQDFWMVKPGIFNGQHIIFKPSHCIEAWSLAFKDTK